MTILSNNNYPTCSALIGELYTQYKDEDGFIYIMYSGENTFGIGATATTMMMMMMMGKNNGESASHDNNVTFDSTFSRGNNSNNVNSMSNSNNFTTRGIIDLHGTTIERAPVNCYITCCSRSSIIGHGDNNR